MQPLKLCCPLVLPSFFYFFLFQFENWISPLRSPWIFWTEIIYEHYRLIFLFRIINFFMVSMLFQSPNLIGFLLPFSRTFWNVRLSFWWSVPPFFNFEVDLLFLVESPSFLCFFVFDKPILSKNCRYVNIFFIFYI